MIFDKIFSKRSTGVEQIDSSSGGMSMYMPTVSGVKVDHDVALTYSAWWGCVRGISETIASLPWNVMTKEGNKKRVADEHPVHSLIKFRPNKEMNAFTFKELKVREMLGRGNFYCEKERNRLGDIVNIWPIDYDRVNVDRDSKGRIVYDISNGTQANTVLKAKDIYHVKGPGGNGLVGYSVVELAKETISAGLAAEKFGGSLFGNGALPSLVITDDGTKKLGPDGVKNMLSTWNKRNRGPRNARSTEYLEKGFDVKQLSINPNDAQFLETRKFQVHEVCRWFRYPVHKLAELDRSTNNNIEAENISFVTDTLMPWICRIESEADVSLFRREDIGRFYGKMVVQGLLRGDLKTRSEFYDKMWRLGVLSIDDILELEDRNPLPDGTGDLRMVPLNMVSVKQAKQQGNSVAPKGTVTKSHYRLMRNIAQRFVTLETKRLKDLSEKTDFKDKIVSFYKGQVDSMVSAFSPAVGTALESMGKSSDKSDAIAANFVRDLVLNSADSVQKAHQEGKIDSLLHSWSSHKAENIADSLLNKVVGYE